ncbi:G-protein coupled receptor 4-like protein, partial [Lates japonicus]
MEDFYNNNTSQNTSDIYYPYSNITEDYGYDNDSDFIEEFVSDVSPLFIVHVVTCVIICIGLPLTLLAIHGVYSLRFAPISFSSSARPPHTITDAGASPGTFTFTVDHNDSENEDRPHQSAASGSLVVQKNTVLIVPTFIGSATRHQTQQQTARQRSKSGTAEER